MWPATLTSVAAALGLFAAPGTARAAEPAAAAAPADQQSAVAEVVVTA